MDTPDARSLPYLGTIRPGRRRACRRVSARWMPDAGTPEAGAPEYPRADKKIERRRSILCCACRGQLFVLPDGAVRVRIAALREFPGDENGGRPDDGRAEDNTPDGCVIRHGSGIRRRSEERKSHMRRESGSVCSRICFPRCCAGSVQAFRFPHFAGAIALSRPS